MEKSTILFARMFIMMIFLMGSVSAFEFDNSKSYDLQTKTATITNAFGLGSKIADITLDTPEVVYVNRGYQLVAQFTVDSVGNYTNFFQGIKFVNLRDGQQDNSKSFDFKYATYTPISVNDYTCQAQSLKNGTNQNNCSVLVGSHIEQQVTWNTMVKGSIPQGKTTIGVFTTVNDGDIVEWIPKLYGVEIEEWAIYHETLVLSGDNTAQSRSDTRGDLITVWRNNTLIAQTYAAATPTNATLWVKTGSAAGTILESVSIISGNASFTTQLNATYVYYVTANAGAGSYEARANNTATGHYPRSNNHISANASVVMGGSEYTDQTEVWRYFFTTNGTDPLSNYMISPANSTNFTTTVINFSGNISNSSTVGVANVSLIINGSINQTNASAFSGFYNFTANLPDGLWNWTLRARGNDSSTTNAVNGTFYLTVDTISPTVNTANFTDSFVVTSLPTNLIWNYTANDVHIQNCYYNTSDNPTYSIVTCNSTISTAFATEGNKTIQYCANDTLGLQTCKTGYNNIILLSINQTDNPDPVGEGVSEKITLNVSRTSALPSTTATLFLNNTIYSPNVINTSSTWTYFEVNTVIPQGWGNSTGRNVSWFWNYTVSGITTNATTSTQTLTVYSLAIDDCSTFGDLILNMTLNDEASAVFVNGSAGSEIQIDLQISSKENSSFFVPYNATYTNVTYADVCVPSGLLNSSQYRIDIVSEYSATDHTIEFFYLDNGTLNSSAYLDQFTNTTVNLYDLLLTDSTTFLFTFLDEDNVEVPDAIVHVFRQYIGAGLFREIERGKQDDNGETHIHLVEEDVIYFFKVSLEGELLFTSSTYNAKCLSSPCSIELTASTENPTFETNFTTVNGTYSILTYPNQRTVGLVWALNDPATMNLTILKEDYQGNLTVVNYSTTTSTGSSINLTLPQSAGNVTFYAVVYRDGEFVTYVALNLQPKAFDYFGATGLIMASLMVLALVLMAISEGAGVIVFLIFALIVASIMGVLDLGFFALMGLIGALMILIFKLIQRRK